MNQQSIWQYVATLKPKLRGNVEIYPQIYRGERWYVLHDQSAEQYMRLNERTYNIVGRFDGILTLEEILEYTNEVETENPLSQEDIVNLLGQLDAAEVLKGGLPINAQDLFQQYKANKKKKRKRSFMNPLSIKLPLVDPDRFLSSLAPLGRIVFSPTGFWIWLFAILLALLLALTHLPELIEEVHRLEFSSEQLIALWFIYPMIKLLHELGHGLALKVWGGEVHEMGINLLVFMPVPYVDATASWGFISKWRRMAVGASGIFVELFLASLALFLWLAVEPGLLKVAALNVMLIATFSTLLFNGNPLLRYDGYFVLEDWLEIPNLATRSKKYYYYLIQKYILKIPYAQTPITAKGEEKWFLIYGFFAPLYRLVILLSIALYLIDSFLIIGIALASWAIVMQVIVPIAKGLKFLTVSKGIEKYRFRAMGFIGVGLLCIVGILSIPVPVITYTEGVVWTVGNAQVTAATSGFIENNLVSSSTHVVPDKVLYQLEDDVLKTETEVLKFKLKEIEAKYRLEQRENRVKAAMVYKDLETTKAEYQTLMKKQNKLTIRSKSEGEFVAVSKENIVGQYVYQGEILGHIINPNNLIIKAVVPQERMGLLETYKTTVSIKLASHLAESYQSTIIRKTPQASKQLPNPVLGTKGGGMFTVDKNDKSATRLFVPAFLIDLSIPDTLHLKEIGSRVYVRLNHGKLSLAKQIGLRFHQLFLRHFYHKLG